MTKLLIAKGADIKFKNKNGQTIIEMCEGKHPHLEEYLYSIGAEKG